MKERDDVVYLKNEAEARLVASVLKEKGIPHFVRSLHDSAYDGIFQQQSGWGYLECPAEFLEDIRSICNDLLE